MAAIDDTKRTEGAWRVRKDTEGALVCERCGARNYKRRERAVDEGKARLTLKKYCPACDAHTVHQLSK